MGGTDEVYSEYIAARKTDERHRRQRVEDRGAAIVTTSSSLLTLVFLLTVFIGGDRDAARLTDSTATGLLLIALACFIVAVVLGISVQHTMWKSKRVAHSTLKSMFDGTSDWGADASDARRICAFLDYEILCSISAGTQLRTKLVLAALGVQCLAVILLVIALAIEFHSRGWF